MRRMLLLPVLALLATPLLTPASQATASARPVFREYPSPIGDAGTVGLPIPPDVSALPLVPGQQTGLGNAAAEPTLGINPKTGAVMFQSLQQTLRVSGFDAAGNGTSSWQDATDVVEGAQTSDPMIYTDPKTGRTWVNQLLATQCSAQAYTDNDGKSWNRSALGCGPGIAFDHQSIVTGPKTEAGRLPAPVGYPNYLYYCTNDAIAADCAVSIDGGVTFLPATPAYSLSNSDCSKIFGHLKTSPTGTLYLPPDGCGTEQGVFVSDDNTGSWTYRPVPGSSASGDAGHPSIGVARDGTAYFAWGSIDAGTGGRTHVAVTTDKGAHWTREVPLGADLGVRQSRFPVVVGGDGDRAAVGFLGTSTLGDANSPAFTGTWRFYVAQTYDRGRSWRTYDATPRSPIQVGPVCTNGTVSCLGTSSGTTVPVGVSSPTRNLLDFIDMDLDLTTGRIVAALADGCLKPTGCTTRDRASKALIVRGVAGTPLLRSAPLTPSVPTAVRANLTSGELATAPEPTWLTRRRRTVG